MTDQPMVDRERPKC